MQRDGSRVRALAIASMAYRDHAKPLFLINTNQVNNSTEPKFDSRNRLNNNADACVNILYVHMSTISMLARLLLYVIMVYHVWLGANKKGTMLHRQAKQLMRCSSKSPNKRHCARRSDILLLENVLGHIPEITVSQNRELPKRKR